MKRLLVLTACFFAFSCEGNIAFFGDGDFEPLSVDGTGKDGSKTPVSKDPALKGPISPGDQSPNSAIPRLSQREFESVISSVFNISDLATKRLPPDVQEPFDTDQESKKMSRIFVEGMESMASEIAKKASSDATWVNEMGGCTPTPGDRACMESFTKKLGKLLWRTELSSEILTLLVDGAMGFSKDGKDASYGLRFVIQSLLMSPRFVYRVGLGEANGDLVRYTNEELIMRLSFLLWGTAPTTTLMEKAKGETLTSENLAKIANEMLEDPKSDRLIQTFHQFWFGYKNLNVTSALEKPMIAETDALLDRVLVSEKLPWKTLFLSDETYIDKDLAAHYDMDGVTETGWVKYQNPSRSGIFSHGSILSIAARDGNETSVTGRGKEVAALFLCRTILPPPPALAGAKPPEATADKCKSEAYADIQKQGGSCAGCHIQMDPIGTGLEQFDGLGKYREIEYGNENCRISGEGKIVGIGTFNGPKELSKIALESGELTECAVEQFLKFSRGGYTDDDINLKKRIHKEFLASDQNFKAMIIALVSDPTFRFRKVEP